MNSFICADGTAIGLATVLALASAATTGEAADVALIDHVAVVITRYTESVSVYRGETVHFIDEQTGQSFIWRVDTAMSAVDLEQLAPGNVLGGRHVTAYVFDQAN